MKIGIGFALLLSFMMAEVCAAADHTFKDCIGRAEFRVMPEWVDKNPTCREVCMVQDFMFFGHAWGTCILEQCLGKECADFDTNQPPRIRPKTCVWCNREDRKCNDEELAKAKKEFASII